MEKLLKEWVDFYSKVIGITCDFFDLQIPKQRKGFNRLFVVAKGMTPERLFKECTKHFRAWKCKDNSLNKMVASDRTAKGGAYAIWVRDTQEADKKLVKISAFEIKRKSLITETLEERLLHEIKYYTETGKHLDVGHGTLCAGSRFSDGSVPGVTWGGTDELLIIWVAPQYTEEILSAREVVI